MKNNNFQQNSEEEDRKSNCSVLDFSLGSTKEIRKESNSSDIQNLKKELMSEINLPIENEINTQEFIFEENEIDLENKKLLESNIEVKINDTEIPDILRRSKSFGGKNIHKKKYSHIKKDPTEVVSPLKLSRKTFGNVPKMNKKPNEVLCDFQKSIIDNKSCNDDDSLDDLLFSFSETQRTTTPNDDDLHNLLNCRKKMILFKNGIQTRKFKEYENILNSEKLFLNKKSSSNKKINFWDKHIRQIIKDNSNKTSNFCLSRLSAGAIVDNTNRNKEDGLFILGILESAVNERKKRYTTNA